MLIGLLEDDLATQDLLRVVLQGEGHQVDVTATVDACLATLCHASPLSGLPGPDLLMVDLHLVQSVPGTVVIEWVRAHPRFHSLPLILMTAGLFPEQRELARLRVIPLAKPFNIHDLVHLVKTLECHPTA